MQTAMQELINWIENGNETSFYVLRDKAKKLLKKEKEQIITAFEVGYKSCDIDEAFEINKKLASGELHYNQTYNQKIPELLYKDGTPMRKVKLGKEAQELLNEIDNEKKGDLVRLLRWVLKNYSTGTDIDGFFMWENPMGQEFDSMQVVDHYLNNKK